MTCTGVSHIAIGVTDMERAIPFYRDVIGLRVSIDREERRDNPDRPFRRRAVYLRWDEGPGSGYVVLDQQFDRDPAGEPSALFDLCIHHVSFLVDDIYAVMDRAAAAGAPTMGPPARITGDWSGEPSGGASLTAMMKDPDGNIIQVDQWLTDDAEASRA